MPDHSRLNAALGLTAAPPQINRACALILASLVLGLLGGFADAAYNPAPERPEPSALQLAWDFAMFVGVLVLTPWLTMCIRRRRLWARWAMLALLAYGWLMVAQDIPSEWPRSNWVAVTETITTLMELIATWLLFFGRGGQWLADDRTAD